LAKKFLTWLLLFIGISLIFQSFQEPDEAKLNLSDIVISSTDSEYSVAEFPQIKITNNLEKTIRIESECPSEPLKVERYSNGVWEAQESKKGLHVVCDDMTEGDLLSFVQPKIIVLPAKESITLDYSPWKSQIFSELGKYKVTLTTEIENVQKEFSTEFSIKNRGFISNIGYHFFYRPIYNVMLFLISILPGNNFGLAIIVLTFLIRLVLLVPNQKALGSQRAMMKIQPELDAIRNKYKGNQEKISQETMLLWKKHRVNPIGGCLPLLIQMPILISLFYVVKSGFTPYQGEMIYSFLENVNLSLVDTNFYGILDLQEVNIIWLPLLVGMLQFFQLKLSFSRRSKQQKHGKEVIDVVDENDKKDKKKTPENPMQMMSKSMMYFMPVMMALMAASLPSGVGVYLVISTLFGIGQQYFVNKSVG
jgi:YidC/Oxa1 family membrane protein insertase